MSYHTEVHYVRPPASTIILDVCNDCGCVVRKETVHDQWHADRDAEIASLRRGLNLLLRSTVYAAVDNLEKAVENEL